MTQLIRYEQARQALAACHSVDEVKDIRDKAEAMAAYARLAKDTDMIQWATEIKVRAERQAGAMLAQMPKAQGVKFDGRAPDGAFRQSHDDTAQTLADVGVSKLQSSRWQSLASMTDEHFETAVATAKDTVGQVTTAFMLREAKAASSKRPTLRPKKLTKADAARLDALEAHRATTSVLVGHIRMVLMCLRGKDSLTDPEREALGQLQAEIENALGVYCA